MINDTFTATIFALGLVAAVLAGTLAIARYGRSLRRQAHAYVSDAHPTRGA